MDRKIGIPPDWVVHDDTFMAADTPPPRWHVDEAIKAAHKAGWTGKGVTVGVGDTGVFEGHPHFENTVFAARKDFTGSSLRDRAGHGTHVVGDLLSWAPGVRVVWAKVLGDDGSGSTRWINAGRRWMADQGADVISESLGDGGGPPIREDIEAYEHAYAQGTSLCVAAAGNAGFSGRGSTVGRPGSYDVSWCQGATRQDGSIAGFSSGGPELDAATPGERIVSTSNRGGWVAMSGTSMATPIFAGLMALIIGKRRAMGKPELVGRPAWREWFQHEGFMLDRGAPGEDDRYGLGVPDVRKILEWLAETTWV